MSSDVYESFINTIRAEAWDEGHAAGWTDAARGKVLALRLLASGVLGVNPEVDGNQWSELQTDERLRQIAKGYDAAHDDLHGLDHLLMWADDYLRRGKHIEASGLIVAARAWAMRHPVVNPDTIRAERVAPDRKTFVDFADDWYDRNAGPDETWTLGDLYDALLASGFLGVNPDTIRAGAWDEGIAAFVQYDEGLMIAEMNRDATIPDYPTNPYQKAAGA